MSRRWTVERRVALAKRVDERLEPVLVPLGFVWAVAVLFHNDCITSSAAKGVLETLSWAIYPVFVLEYVARWFITPGIKRFIQQHGWELLILAVPFLRFARILRIGRTFSLVASRSNTRGKTLRQRVMWLGAVHVFVILGSANVLCDFAGYASAIRRPFGEFRYLRALHDAAFSATSGEPLSVTSGVGAVLEVVLAVWAVVVFAAVAATFGGYLLGREVLAETTDQTGSN